MFKIPDWEEDIPKSTVNFEKKAKRKKESIPTKTQQTAKKNGAVNNKVLPKVNHLKAKVEPLRKTFNLKTKANSKPEENYPKIKVNNSPNFKTKVNRSPKIDAVKTNGQNNVKKNYVTAPTNTQNIKKKNTRKRKHEFQLCNTKNNKKYKHDDTENKKIDDVHPEEASELFLNTKTKNLAFNIQSKKLFSKKEKLKKLLENNRSTIAVSGDKLRQRMLDRLKAAQFRYLNEKLYTSSGSEAQELFQSDPAAFQTYHQGYQQQLKKWPVNPLDVIVKKIMKMPKTHLIADMGCGEAALSKRVPQTVRSFDLVSAAAGVEVCDMAHTPLLAASVDVAVYCLALMGTQLTQYIVEANRVLKPGGQLLIAEVESRFDDVDSFARDVEKLGFKLKNLDKTNKVFFFLQFVKNRDPPKKGKPELSLKPCLYKKR